MNGPVIAVLGALACHAACAQPPARPQPDTPRRHQIQFATSDDGLTFTEGASPVMLHASAPDVLEMTGAGSAGEKGWLSVYGVDARHFGGPGTERLCRLVSRDGGKTWGEPEPVTVSGVSGGVPADPAAVQLPDGRVRLYYLIVPPGATGRSPGDPRWPRTPDQVPEPRSPLIPNDPPARPPSTLPPRKPSDPIGPGRVPDAWPNAIGSAISDDGRNFKAEEGVRMQSAGLTDPEVAYCAAGGAGGAGGAGDASGQWLMFLNEGERVVLARSRDGLRFERDGVFELAGGGAPGGVVLLDGRVRVFCGSGDGITSAAYDPRTQTVEAEPGVRLRGTDPSVVARADGGYVMVFRRGMAATVP